MNKDTQVMKGFRDIFNKIVLLNKSEMEIALKEYKSSEVHCIEYIGQNEDGNVTKLAEAFYMTRGAISKLTQKLITKGVIESYKKAENNKEIYFRLTKQGKATYAIHERLHKKFQDRDKAVFEDITEEQFDTMINFIDKYNGHLDTEIKKQDNTAKL